MKDDNTIGSNKFFISVVAIAVFVVILVVGMFKIYGIPFKNNFLQNNFNFGYRDQNLQNISSTTYQTLYSANKLQEVQEYLDSKLVENPEDITALLQKAQALAQEASLTYKEKDLGDKALSVIELVLKQDPRNIQALALKGYVYEIQEDYVNASKYYDQALALDPTNVDTLAQKGHMYDLQGNQKDAEALYKKVLEIDPNNEQGNVGIARIYFSKGDFDNAVKIYEKIISTTSNIHLKAESYYSAGTLYSAQRKPDKAFEYMELSTETDPSYSLGWVGYGAELFNKARMGNNLSNEQKKNLLDKSFAALQQAVETNPNQTYAFLQLASEFGMLKQKDISLKALAKADAVLKNDISLSKNEKEEMRKRIDTVRKAVNKL